MKFLFALPLVLFLAMPAAHARLGETEGQSQQRYGQPNGDLIGANDKPLMPGTLEKAYSYQGWRVRVAFAGGVCVRIEYVHIPQDGAPQKIAEAEMAAILDAEKGKFSWREEKATKQPGAAGEIEKALKGAFNVRKWQRSDHATAELALGLVIRFESRDAQEIAKRLAKAAKEMPAAGATKVPKF
jgi:hypothetical protein